MPPAIRRALELRLDGAQAAPKKIKALLERAGADDRIRGAFKYHGAATGRWSGEGFQAQNLKKPAVEDLEAAIEAVATGDYKRMSHYPRPLSVLGDCTRAMITAAPGHVLIGADFSAIESRVLAWVAGEQWKLDAYRRFDATQAPQDEPYRVLAGRLFRVPAGAITDEQRSSGKVCDLAFGYQGGANAFRVFADGFTDAEIEQFKADWRAAHPNIKRFWYDIDRAALVAVHDRGRVTECGPVKFKTIGAFLYMKLPSGRKISYPLPAIMQSDRGARVTFTDNAMGQFKPCRNGAGAYGGLWTENVVSAIARDILASAMQRLEAAGYPVVIHVHDECVCEVSGGTAQIDEFTKLITVTPSWALTLPIAAKAWTGTRYTKS